jgi:PII-like signaling protein
MEKESEAVLLRIFLGESDMFKGKPLHKYLLDLFKKEGLAGATITRALSGYGKTSRLHTSSVLRLSTDLPLVIEVADKKERIDAIKPKLEGVINGGLITEEKIRIIYYEGKKRDPSG